MCGACTADDRHVAHEQNSLCDKPAMLPDLLNFSTVMLKTWGARRENKCTHILHSLFHPSTVDISSKISRNTLLSC